MSVPSVCLSRQSTAAAAAGGFAAEVGRSHQIYGSIVAAAARLVGRVNFDTTVTRSNMVVCIRHAPRTQSYDNATIQNSQFCQHIIAL